MAFKVCTSCGLTKSLNDFYSNCRNKDGKMYFCILCTKKKQLEYRNENREKLTKAQLNRYYSNHEESKSRSIDLRKKNREKYLAREKLWREKNCERVKPVRLLQRKNEYERMANVLSDRYIRMILNRNQTVYLKKEFLPKELIEVKRLEILLTSQMEANNDNAKQHN